MMKIKRIFLAPEAEKDALALELIGKFAPEEMTPVSDILEANHYLKNFSDPLIEGKQSIFLDYFKGRFLEPCPCAREYVRCGYWIISPVVGCPLDCSYCILQGYLTAYPIQVYLNLDKIFQELKKFEKEHPKARLRIGTGELADSLALEPELGYAQKLIKFFSGKKNFIFELKTKTDRIEPLLNLSPKENIVVSWSLNPEEIVKQEEKKSASLSARLKSAKIISERGWLVGFHLDPILIDVGISAYLDLLEQIFQAVPYEKIAWLSLGSLRFPQSLKSIIQARHPESKILSGELFPGKDAKLRYLRPVREKFYRAMADRIQNHSQKILVYLCMESESVWERVLIASPEQIQKQLRSTVSE